MIERAVEVKRDQSDHGRGTTDLEVGTGGTANIVAYTELKDLTLQFFDPIAW